MSINQWGFLTGMEEERRNPRRLIQMARASSLSFNTVNLASPLAEDTFSENTIQKLNFEIQQTKRRLVKPFRRAFVFFELP